MMKPATNPRLQALFADLDKRVPDWRERAVVVRDRTPAGYGPTEEKGA